jgi:hypothetical protein
VVSDIPVVVTGIPSLVTDIPFVVSLSNHPERGAGLMPFDRLRANGVWVWRGQYSYSNEQPRFVVTDIPFVVTDIPSVVTDTPFVVSAPRSW